MKVIALAMLALVAAPAFAQFNINSMKAQMASQSPEANVAAVRTF